MTVLFLYLVVIVSVKGSHFSHDGSSHLSIQDYKYGSKAEFENAFNKWIQTKIDIFSLTDLIDVLLVRLGVNNVVRCENTDEHPMLEAIRNTSRNSNLTDLLNNDQLRNDLFLPIISVAAMSPFEFNPCCSEKLREECIRAKEKFDRMSLRHIYGSVEGKYNRLAVPRHFDKIKLLAYDSETFTNRFMCVNEFSLERTVHIDHGDRNNEENRRNIGLSALMLYILQGYNLVSKNEICPGTHLQAIYTHYRLRDNLQATHGLTSMISDLKCDASKENHQRETPSYRQNSHSLSEIYSGIGSADFIKRYVYSSGQRNQFHDIGDNGHPPLLPPFSRTPNLNPGFLNYDWNNKGSEFVNRQCFDERSLLRAFNVENTIGGVNISMSVFLDMCPVLLYKALFRPCHHHSHSAHRQHTTVSTVRTSSDSSTDISLASNMTSVLNNTIEESSSTPRYKSYLYGSLSVLVISLCSIVGAGFMKLSRADVKIYMMGSMLSLAVGCLVADAALHLLPEVIMGEGDMDEDDDELMPGHLRKLCAFLASIYAFFVLELLLSIRHTHSHAINVGNEQIKSISVKYDKEDDTIRETNLNLISVKYGKEDDTIRETNLNLNNVSIKNNIPKTLNIDQENNTHNTNIQATNNDQQTDSTTQVLEPGLSNPIRIPPPESTRQLLEQRCSSISDRISIHDAQSGVKALAWMIIIGDGIHNFADGLAVGAAFSLNFSKGISTSITVLCHELPHELGDFAILVSTGMSIKRAMVLNFVSSLTAFAGLYLGLSLGEQVEASQWIFAVGAGMFLYVALTDLVPECKEYFKTKCTIKMFVAQNIGLLLGYVAMLLLAMYEDKLEIKS
ncbi:zinc transporter ZIP6-like isoform X2 [Ruditapes philippinarum]|nr:zinc transporter ZIP6-like isoform X2 [Ruditapes philippinarum]XP_060589240.1 zinc transporter ZIP6-like isoform X2 [Ruditapes philippinarum]